MNPTKDNYVYNIAFSMLYLEYVLFMEDDRPFILDIESKIIYKNYIEEAVLVMNSLKNIYGITFKPDIPGDIIVKKVNTALGEHILCILYRPKADYYYVNGPTIYITKYLKLLKNYINEHSTALFFKKLNIYNAYTYKNISCNSNKFSIVCQSASLHLDYDRKFSTNKNNRCKNYMY